jgi:hypothetical protein
MQIRCVNLLVLMALLVSSSSGYGLARQSKVTECQLAQAPADQPDARPADGEKTGRSRESDRLHLLAAGTTLPQHAAFLSLISTLVSVERGSLPALPVVWLLI